MQFLKGVGLSIAILDLFLVFSSARIIPTSYTPDELVQKAIQASQELKLSDADFERSRQELKNARTSYLPRLNLQGTLGIDLFSVGSFDASRNMGSDLILDWNFFQNGLVFLRIEQAKAQVELTLLQRKRQEIELSFHIKNMTYDLIEKRKSRRVDVEEFEWVRQSLERAKVEFKQGRIHRGALLKSRMQFNEKQNQLDRSRREYRHLAAKLKEETGIPSKDKIRIRLEGPEKRALKKRSDLLSLALDNRVEVRECKIQFDLSKKAVKVAKLGRLPRLDLFAGNAFALDDFERSTDQFQFRTGVIARYPLYDGGETKLQIILAQLGQKRAEFQWHQSEKRIHDEVEESYQKLLDASLLLKAGQAQLKAVHDEVEQAEIEFKNGSLSPFEWFEVTISFKRARLQYLSLEMGVVRSNAALVKVMGFNYLSEVLKGLETQK